ncbi:MAG: hypothetical protein ACOCWO_00585 [Candidatus Muiribacteriaceae bacterium]
MKRNGSVYIIVLLASAVVYIISMGFIFLTTTVGKQEIMDKNRIIAKYLSESGVELGYNEIYNIFYSDLFNKEKKTINYDKLTLLDPELAPEFSKVLEKKRFIEDGDIYVGIEVLNVTTNSQLACNMKVVPGEEEKVPERLNIYKGSEKETSGKLLGGYVATLRLTSKGIYRKREFTTTVTKSIKVINISPIGEEYTLFISGPDEEYLKFGKFTLSNWTVDSEQVSGLVTKIKSIADKAQTQIPNTSVNDFASMLNFVKQFVLFNKDSEIKKEASNLLFNLDFRKWGRIRTNGILHVYLPFFEVDDIINYFVDNKYYSKPEVGYVGCENRLHDLYLGKYTRYEGNIRKHYWRLAPYILTRRFPVERNDKYTRFSTDTYYAQEHPDEKDPENIILTRPTDIERFLHQEANEDLVMHGTRTEPVRLNGLMHIDGSLSISGYVKGRGALIVKGNLIIEGNIKYADNTSMLSLISVNNPIVIKNTVENAEIDGAVYGRQSIQGGKKLKINGNLVVHNLNRQSGPDARDTLMPREVEIIYDKRLRNYYARHIYGGVSLQPKTKYITELTESTLDQLKTKEKNMHK